VDRVHPDEMGMKAAQQKLILLVITRVLEIKTAELIPFYKVL
jgi:hypothetical protein